MSENIDLRKATAEDMTVLHDLYVDTIDGTCMNDYDESQRRAWKNGIENKYRWSTAIDEQYFLIAEIAGEVAGFGSLKDGFYIDFMYTGRNHQRKGVARAIYNRLQAQAERLGTKSLIADVSITAIPFFEGQGFEIVKENRNFIENTCITNYQMRKCLG